MNEQAMLHIPDSRFCFADSERSIVLRLRVARGEPLDRVEVIWRNKYDFPDGRYISAMRFACADRLFDWYETRLELDDVRFAYVFRLTAPDVVFFYC